MASELRFDGKVVIVTGAGNGLGRSHALLFGSRGAKVVVNDLGGSAFGGGKSSAAADAVVQAIKDGGGQAVANYDSVEDGDKIVKSAVDAFGRVDIIVNNAGILRDQSFRKMSKEDWDLIVKVHVNGAFAVTHAAWPGMLEQGYGRIVNTASAAGIYGNFGQANYALAKLGLVGFSQTLALEGRKKNVFVNTIAPIAGSRLTETVLPKELIDALKPEFVSPLVAFLAHESCQETGGLFEVGGGFFAKLRWERAKGKTFRVGRSISVEDIKSSFGQITSFKETTHPTDINNSMAPIMENIQAGPSKGGNEFIDVDAAMAFKFPEMTSSYDERDLAIYALGVGAAADPLDDKELSLVYENSGAGFKALPTYGVIPVMNGLLQMAKEGKQAEGLNYGFDRILHGEQLTEVKRPLPPKAKLTHKTKVKDIFDKGKGAVVITETRSYDESGEELIYNEYTTFVRGAGGWGGERGPSAEINVPPSRAADATTEQKINDNQALLYRLTGDWNPLHADPSFAQAFGFPKPILHGLCTFGYAARHVINAFSKGDPRLFKSIKVRFADSVFPGETLVTEMWKESDTRIVFRCKVKERDKVVISNAAIELYTEIPKPKAKAAPAPSAAAGAPSASASAEPISADIFAGIAAHVAKHPELAGKIKTNYLFKLTAPESQWTVDLSAAPGKVEPGAHGKADCTLELSDANFLAMCTGKADAQKLYFGGQLKISGNVMASQKLEFLKQVDPATVLEAAKKRAGAGGGAAAPEPHQAGSVAGGGEGEYRSSDVFVAIADHIARSPETVSKVNTVYQFKLTGPDSVWTVDLKNGAGSVAPGGEAKADCTLELADADFIAMTQGKADPQKLYFGGKLKISGNVMASQKLEFLKKMDPERAKVAVAEARAKAGSSGAGGGGAGGGAAAAAASAGASKASGPKAPAIFERLAERLAKTPALASEVGGTIVFKLPEGSWVARLTGDAPSVARGEDKAATTTLTIADEDLAALAAGTESAQALHQRGKLRIDGDVRLAHRLGFLKGLA